MEKRVPRILYFLWLSMSGLGPELAMTFDGLRPSWRIPMGLETRGKARNGRPGCITLLVTIRNKYRASGKKFIDLRPNPRPRGP